MPIFFALLLALVLPIALLAYVFRICRRTPALMPWRSALVLAVAVWASMVLVKRYYLDAIFPPRDGAKHFARAQWHAEQISNGYVLETLGEFRLGNRGYQLIQGILYALTDAPEICVYAINAALALFGLFMLLESICIATQCRRLPGWLWWMIAICPSALYWSPMNLKEGATLWSGCLLLRAALVLPPARRVGVLAWASVGFIGMAILRPHFAMAYLAAIGVGYATSMRKPGLAAITLIGFFVSYGMMATLRPELISKFEEDGLLEGLENRYQSLNDIGGSAIKYANGGPTPIISGLILIFFRPFPHEVDNLREVLAGAEVWILSLAGFYCWLRLRRPMHHLLSPFVLTCALVLLFASLYFTYIYNMGLMVRHRLMVFPALLAFLAYPTLMTRGAFARRSIPPPRGEPRRIPKPVAAARFRSMHTMRKLPVRR